MSRLVIKGYDVVAKGDQEVGFESTASDNSTPIEYHAFMSLEGAYLIEKIDRQDTTNVRYTYYFNQPHRSGDFERDWNERQALPFVRYDEVIEKFFSENNTSDNPVRGES